MTRIDADFAPAPSAARCSPISPLQVDTLSTDPSITEADDVSFGPIAPPDDVTTFTSCRPTIEASLPGQLPDPAGVADMELHAEVDAFHPLATVRVFALGGRSERKLVAVLRPARIGQQIWHGVDPRALPSGARISLELPYSPELEGQGSQYVYVHWIAIRWTTRRPSRAGRSVLSVPDAIGRLEPRASQVVRVLFRGLDWIRRLAELQARDGWCVAGASRVGRRPALFPRALAAALALLTLAGLAALALCSRSPRQVAPPVPRAASASPVAADVDPASAAATVGGAVGRLRAKSLFDKMESELARHRRKTIPPLERADWSRRVQLTIKHARLDGALCGFAPPSSCPCPGPGRGP